MVRVPAVLVLVLGSFACGGDNDGPSAPRTNCTNIAGSWFGTYANSCGGAASGSTAVAQSSCNVTLQALGLTAEGQIAGNTITFNGRDANCSGTNFSGTATVHSASSITGTYSGMSNGGFGCCPRGNISGSFTLTR